MAVMKKMRESTKILMVVVAVAFVGLMVFQWGADITGAGSRGPTYVGKVNGVHITPEEYQFRLENLYQQARAERDEPLTEAEVWTLQDQSWTALVNEILLRQEAKKRGISVSDEEIIALLKNRPPDFLLQAPAFQTDGQFDFEKYRAALNNPLYNDLWLSVEQVLRRELPMLKLREQLTAGLYVTEEELRQAFRARQERVTVRYLTVDPELVVPGESVSVSEEAVERYYREHREEFRRPEQARLSFVVAEVFPTAADSAVARERSEGLLREVQERTDFVEVIQREGTDPLARGRAGDLGFVAVSALDSALARAVESAKPGSLLGPILSPWGYRLIRVEERRSGEEGQPEVHLRRLLIPIEAGPRTREAARAKVQELLARVTATGLPLAEVAKEIDLESRTTPYFSRQSAFIPGLGVLPQAVDFAFRAEVGTESDVIAAPGGFYLVELTDRRSSGIPPLPEVRPQIISHLEAEARRAKARDVIEMVKTALASGNGLEEVGELLDLPLRTSGAVTRFDPIEGLGREPELVGAAFGLPVGTIGGPVETDRAIYFLTVLDREPIDQEAFAAQRAALRAQLLEAKRQRIFAEWFQAVKEHAEIEDHHLTFLGRS